MIGKIETNIDMNIKTTHIIKLGLLATFLVLVAGVTITFGQQVDNKGCPVSYKRNNGNGQEVTVFAQNITPTSTYALNALRGGAEGTLTFEWVGGITNPPVISKTWTTTEGGLTTQNWSFGNNSAGSPFNPPGVPANSEVMYSFYKNNLPTAGSITIELADPSTSVPFATCTYPLSTGSKSITISENTTSGVSSGKTGGLESESLGTSLAERMYLNSLENEPARVNYEIMPRVSDYSRLRTDALGLLSFMPDQQILGPDFIGYITSPNDILTFTNAVEVISVDYVEKGVNKGVAFCTKTLNKIYTHTKPVCDRLKGSELLSVDTIRKGDYKLLVCYLKTDQGITEYTVSFSVGLNQNDKNYILQSEWLTADYQSQQVMYNFQLWSSELSILNKLIDEVLLKLNNDFPVKQVGPAKRPSSYITKAARDLQNQLSLKLNVYNNTSSTSGTLIVSGKENEQSSTTYTRSFPITLKPFGLVSTELPVKNLAESEVDLLVNNRSEDVI